jgi:hypothetical protein
MTPTDPNFGGYDIVSGQYTHGNGGVRVRFFRKSVKDEEASQVTGRPVYRDVDYISKLVPGDKYNIPTRPVREQDKLEFAPAWDAYQLGLTEKHDGMPLEEWPQVTRSQVDDMRHLGIFTVEELAGVSDANLERINGGTSLRQKARDYLARAQVEADKGSMQEALRAKDDELAALRKQLEEAKSGVTAPSVDDGKKKGKG